MSASPNPVVSFPPAISPEALAFAGDGAPMNLQTWKNITANQGILLTILEKVTGINFNRKNFNDSESKKKNPKEKFS